MNLSPQKRIEPVSKHEKRIGRPCKNCGGTLRYGLSYSCVACTVRRSSENKKNPHYKVVEKIGYMRRRYGITPNEMLAMLKSQGGACAICGGKDPKNEHGWCVDHDHTTGIVRGVLCDPCNNGLGRFNDSVESLNSAIRYLCRAAIESAVS